MTFIDLMRVRFFVGVVALWSYVIILACASIAARLAWKYVRTSPLPFTLSVDGLVGLLVF